MVLTPEQIAEMDSLTGVQSLSPDVISKMDIAAGVSQPQEQGFLGGIGEDIGRRVGIAEDIKQRYAEGETSLPSAVLQGLGNVGFGLMGDIGGRVGMEALDLASNIVPESYEQATAQSLETLAQSPVGQAGLQALQTGGEAWGEFKQQHPDVAGNLEAVGNIALTLPGTAIGAKGTEMAVKGLGKGVKGAGKLARAPFSYVSKKLSGGDIDIIPDDLLQRATSGKYKQLKDMGELLPESVSDTLLKTKTKIEGVRIADELMPESVKGFADQTERYKGLVGKELSFEDAELISQELGDKITESLKNGKATRETLLLRELQDDFRGAIDEIPEGAINREARELYKVRMKTDEFSRIIERAGMTDNPATSMKAGFRTLYNNKKRMRGFSTEEKEMIKGLAEGSFTADTLRTVLGSRLIGNVVGASAGGLPGAAAGTALSAAARGGAEAIQVRNALKVLEKIQRPAKEIIKRGTK